MAGHLQVLKDEEYKAKVLSRTPMGRVGDPQEVAGEIHRLLDGARPIYLLRLAYPLALVGRWTADEKPAMQAWFPSSAARQPRTSPGKSYRSAAEATLLSPFFSVPLRLPTIMIDAEVSSPRSMTDGGL